MKRIPPTTGPERHFPGPRSPRRPRQTAACSSPAQFVELRTEGRILNDFVQTGRPRGILERDACWLADLEAAVAVENLPVDPCTLVGEKKIYEVRCVVGGAETPRGGGADA